MDRITIAAFSDELIKIAESPAREANNFFGLPVSPPRRGVRRWENGPPTGMPQQPSQIQGNVDPNATAETAQAAPKA